MLALFYNMKKSKLAFSGLCLEWQCWESWMKTNPFHNATLEGHAMFYSQRNWITVGGLSWKLKPQSLVLLLDTYFYSTIWIRLQRWETKFYDSWWEQERQSQSSKAEGRKLFSPFYHNTGRKLSCKEHDAYVCLSLYSVQREKTRWNRTGGSDCPINPKYS